MSDPQRQQMKDKWLKESVAAFEACMGSPELTMLDQYIFVDQFKNVLVSSDVCFPDIDDSHIKRIRSSRLKLLGYVWNKDQRKWSKSSE